MPASLGDLVISIAGDIAKLELAMSRAELLTAQTAQKIDKAMEMASQSIAGLAAGFLSFKAIDAFTDNINGAIEAGAELHKVAIQAGISGEALSAFKGVARQSGTSLEELAKGLGQIEKNMLLATSGTGKQAMAFKAMGLSVTDARGNLKSIADFAPEMAEKLSTMGNETQKVGEAMILAGRNGRVLLPFFQDLADAGTLTVKVTKEQQEAYYQYEKVVRSLTGAKAALYNTIASQVIPVYTALAKTLLELRTGTDGLNERVKKLAQENAIRNWAIDAAIGLTTVIDVVINVGKAFALVFENVGRGLAVVARFFAESFQNIATVIGVASASVSDFAQLFAGLSVMMSGQWELGWKMVQDAWSKLGAGAEQLKDRFKESFTNIAGQARSFAEDLQSSVGSFTQSNITLTLMDQFAKMGAEVDKTRKKVNNVSTDLKELKENALEKLIEALDKTAAKLSYEISYLEKFGIATKYASQATTEIALSTRAMQPLLESMAAGLHVSVEELKNAIVARAAWNDAQATSKDILEGYIKAQTDEINTTLKSIESLQTQIETYGMSAAAITRYKIQILETSLAEEQAINGMSKRAEEMERQIARLQTLAGKQDQFLGLENFVAMIGQAADRVGQIAGAFTGGVVKGIEAAKSALKSFIAEIIALFAKRLFLNIVANATGNSAIGAMAGQAGANSLAGGALSAAGSYLGSTAIGGALGEFGSAAIGSFVGPVMEGTAAAYGTAVYSALMSIPVWGWIAAAVLAIGTIADRFRDHENWQATLGFGANAQAYTTQGVFGPEGFASIQGDDATNRAIQAFMASTGTIDHIIAATLSSAQIATITQNLGAAYTTRNDGQPAQFAFGPDDHTAPAQLTLEYLQHKYGIIFDSIDSTFADFIRHFTGTSEELLQQIGQEAQFLNSISLIARSIGATTLTLDAVRGFQMAGETLQQTFTRVVTGWAQFTNTFTSDADKLILAQTALTDFGTALAAVGLALPTDNAGWLALRNSLDLTTESGRALYNQMMAVTPAFQLVTSAAASAVDRFNSIATQLSPAYGASNAHDQLIAAVNAWRQLGNNAQRTADMTISDIAAMVAGGPAAIAAARAYAEGLGVGALGKLNDMLAAYTAWLGAQGPSSGGSAPLGGGMGPSGVDAWGNHYGPTPAVTDLANAAASAAQRLMQLEQSLDAAKLSLKRYSEGLGLNAQLSTLTPMEQLADAASQYQKLLALAQAGDIGAIGQLSGAANTYLSLARSIYASSSGYNAIFDQVQAGLGSVQDAQLPADVIANALSADGPINQNLTDLNALITTMLTLLGTGLTVADPAVAAALRAIQDALAAQSNHGVFA